MHYENLYLKKNKISKILNLYKIFINRVGIKNLYYPFIFDNNKGKLFKSVGLWNLSVSLNNFKRGVHMSRFIFILNKLLLKFLNLKNFFKFYKFFIYKLYSNDFFLQLSFVYFLKKFSPITLNKSFLNYKITLMFEKNNLFFNSILKLILPLSSLCPCSKYISLYGAHNQRIYVSVFIFLKKNKKINLNNFINDIELYSSSSLWSILKREDEKFFTEFSYKNPKFIEDVTRDLSFYLKKKKFFLKIENLESIHNHNVYSFLKNF